MNERLKGKLFQLPTITQTPHKIRKSVQNLVSSPSLKMPEQPHFLLNSTELWVPDNKETHLPHLACRD